MSEELELDPLYQPGVTEVLDEIENDPKRVVLWNGIVDGITLICDRPGSSQARRFEMSSVFPETVWRVPVPSGLEDENYSILWSRVGPDAVIHYVGPWPPRTT